MDFIRTPKSLGFLILPIAIDDIFKHFDRSDNCNTKNVLKISLETKKEGGTNEKIHPFVKQYNENIVHGADRLRDYGQL